MASLSPCSKQTLSNNDASVSGVTSFILHCSDEVVVSMLLASSPQRHPPKNNAIIINRSTAG
jgi:hypothetical protein